MTLAPYRRYFSPSRFWRRLGTCAKTAGTKTVYTALLLYYAYEREETPSWAKRTVIGVLGYLLMPLDAVPDLTPILGYTDDIGVLGAGLIMVAAYVNQDVRKKARAKLGEWIPEPDSRDLEQVEKQL